MKTKNRPALAVSAWLAVAGPAGLAPAQQGQFYLIGPDIVLVTGVSNNGVVVGQVGDLAVRWSVAGGLQFLGTLPGHDWSVANAVSGDGSVIIGTSRVVADNRAFRWTVATGMQPLLPAWTSQSFGEGVSTGGAYATGHLTSPDVPFLWSGGAGMTMLPLPPGMTFGGGYDVSADGRVVVGYAANTASELAVRWVDGSPFPLPVASGWAHPISGAVSADGHTAVGTWSTPTFSQRQAVRWVDGGAGEVLPQGTGSVAALDVSADGSVIVGYTGAGACRWTSAGMTGLTSLIQSMGLPLGGATLSSASAVSPDGRIIAGHALQAGFHRGWVLVLPASGCYANCDGSSAAPTLNIADFSCFLVSFAAGDAHANCDGSTAAPMLNVADFTCFLQRFAAGCP